MDTKIQSHYFAKAAYLGILRRFTGWNEALFTNKNKFPTNSGYSDGEYAELQDKTVVYIQADYRVTKTPFLTPDTLIFDKVSDEWVKFVNKQLRFQLPDPEEVKAKGMADEEDGEEEMEQSEEGIEEEEIDDELEA